MFGSDCLVPSKPRSSRRQLQTPQSDPLKCPRCKSTNTKFCYYNNYNKTQPRHFCKACKRHWTKGGILRNVPVGGGQKNKRFRRPNNATSTATATITVGPMVIRKNPNEDHDAILGIGDSKDISYDTAKTTLFKPTDNEERDDVESYTNIEELKSLVSWDLYGSFSGCTMQQLPLQDHQILGFSKHSSSLETNPSSTTSRLFIEKLENVEDSTSTTSMIMPSYQQWQVPNTSNFLELDNWKWNDLDTMILADIKKPWEDPQFKT